MFVKMLSNPQNAKFYSRQIKLVYSIHIVHALFLYFYKTKVCLNLSFEINLLNGKLKAEIEFMPAFRQCLSHI